MLALLNVYDMYVFFFFIGGYVFSHLIYRCKSLKAVRVNWMAPPGLSAFNSSVYLQRDEKIEAEKLDDRKIYNGNI